MIDSNEMAFFACMAMGGPDNSFTWYYDGQEVSDNITIIVTNDAINPTYSELTISNATATNGGEYICNVSNVAGHDTATGTLLVRPFLVTEPVPLTLTTNGSSVTLECDGESFPDPTYLWEMMMNSEEDYIIVINTTDQNLSFDPVVFGDEGTYRCTVVSEGAGNVTTNDSVLTSE